jgi:phosphate transport system substrate-binding protein
VKLNYQPIGSGGGIKQIQGKLVDFGASDKPLSSHELAASNLVQFPTVIGGVVPIVNLPELQGQPIKLSGPLLANIYLGKINQWNDAKIKALNPSLALPDRVITVVHRSDGSGTTFLFTNYLDKVSPDWHKQVGSDTAVSWPVGIGGKGNEGVASYVQRVKGGIGYVEFAYAQHNKIMVAPLLNKAGNIVSPSIQSFQAAATHATWSAKNDFSDVLTDASGKDSWPISGATFILMQKTQDKPEQAQAVLDFFTWAYAQGGEMATALEYVPLPDVTVQAIKGYWKDRITDAQGKSILSK